MMHIEVFTFNPFQENTLVLSDETKSCVIVDPGCYEDHEKAQLQAYIEENNLKVERLLNTHCHVDHVLGNAWVARTFGVELTLHRMDLPTFKANEVVAPQYGFAGYEAADPVHFVDEGDRITFGNTNLDILFTPGHAPGHIVFYHREQGVVVGGDVLFRGSIGRTDLPGGDFDTLASSIRTKLYTLPDNVVVYPGHGPETTIGFEKQNNPFVPA
ncbi:MAG: MBL fold metallo-hydrolase [Bacteroidota bacterium]